MKKPYGTAFHFGKNPACIVVLLAVFLFCGGTCASDNPAENWVWNDHPYIWKKSNGEWIISLKPSKVIPESIPWSLFLYYSWTGEDDAAPAELNIETAGKKSSFYFFPKPNSIDPRRSKETFLVFHSGQWKSLPEKITVTAINTPGKDFKVTDIKLKPRPADADPLIADPGTMLNYPLSSFRNRNYETFSHNLYPSLLFLVSDSFAVQSQFLKRLAFFTEKTGFVGKLAADEEIADLRDWFAHDYRAGDLAAFFNLAQKQNFPLNDSEIRLRELLLVQGIIRAEGDSYTEGEGALLGFSVESKDRLPVYYVHEAVHGLEFIIPELRVIFLDFFNSLSGIEKIFLTDALHSRGYNVIEDKQLLASETAAYLLQQQPEETDAYFKEYVLTWYLLYNKDPEVDYSEEPYSDRVTEYLKANPGIFGRRCEALQKEFRSITGLCAENFYDLLPKNSSL